MRKPIRVILLALAGLTVGVVLYVRLVRSADDVSSRPDPRMETANTAIHSEDPFAPPADKPPHPELLVAAQGRFIFPRQTLDERVVALNKVFRRADDPTTGPEVRVDPELDGNGFVERIEMTDPTLGEALHWTVGRTKLTCVPKGNVILITSAEPLGDDDPAGDP